MLLSQANSLKVCSHTKNKNIGSNNRFYTINPPVTVCVKKKIASVQKKKKKIDTRKYAICKNKEYSIIKTENTRQDKVNGAQM